MLRRLILGFLFLGGGVISVTAQHYLLADDVKDWQDFAVQTPCPLMGPAAMASHRDHMLMTFTCVDGRVFLRQFFRPGDIGTVESPSSKCPGFSPGPGFTCVGGGWKPPNWRP